MSSWHGSERAGESSSIDLSQLHAHYVRLTHLTPGDVSSTSRSMAAASSGSGTSPQSRRGAVLARGAGGGPASPAAAAGAALPPARGAAAALVLAARPGSTCEPRHSGFSGAEQSAHAIACRSGKRTRAADGLVTGAVARAAGGPRPGMGATALPYASRRCTTVERDSTGAAGRGSSAACRGRAHVGSSSSVGRCRRALRRVSAARRRRGDRGSTPGAAQALRWRGRWRRARRRAAPTRRGRRAAPPPRRPAVAARAAGSEHGQRGDGFERAARRAREQGSRAREAAAHHLHRHVRGSASARLRRSVRQKGEDSGDRRRRDVALAPAGAATRVARRGTRARATQRTSGCCRCGCSGPTRSAAHSASSAATASASSATAARSRSHCFLAAGSVKPRMCLRGITRCVSAAARRRAAPIGEQLRPGAARHALGDCCGDAFIVHRRRGVLACQRVLARRLQLLACGGLRHRGAARREAASSGGCTKMRRSSAQRLGAEVASGSAHDALGSGALV